MSGHRTLAKHLTLRTVPWLSEPLADSGCWNLCVALGNRFGASKKDYQIAGLCSKGDPASPAGLTAPLVESLRRISSKFSGNGKGRCLHRLFLDDRSWFCEKRKTCLDIGLEWRREVSL